MKTAGVPAKILLSADRTKIKADGTDLSFVTVKILDEAGNLVPGADNLVTFKLEGDAEIAGVDNGLQTSMESFKSNYRKAFNGLALAIIKAGEKPGTISLIASAEGLQSARIQLEIK
jgi:beta-galactosidase